MHALYDLVKDLHPQPQILTPAQRRACPRLWYCCARFHVCVGGEGRGGVCVRLSLSLSACMCICVYIPVWNLLCLSVCVCPRPYLLCACHHCYFLFALRSSVPGPGSAGIGLHVFPQLFNAHACNACMGAHRHAHSCERTYTGTHTCEPPSANSCSFSDSSLPI